MTQAKLDEIKARAAAATKGPWRAGKPSKYGTWHPSLVMTTGEEENTICEVYGLASNVKREELVENYYRQGLANVDFITAARTDVPALVAEVERLKAVLLKYRYCRHGCIECSCVTEAREAVDGKA